MYDFMLEKGETFISKHTVAQFIFGIHFGILLVDYMVTRK